MSTALKYLIGCLALMLVFSSCTKDEALCTPEHESEMLENETRAVIDQEEASGTFSGMGSLSSGGPRSDQPGAGDDEDGDGITDDEDDEDEDDERSSSKKVKK